MRLPSTARGNMRGWFYIALMCVAVVALSSPPALAAEKHGDLSDNQVIGVEGGLFKGAAEVSLWTILVFLILLSVLRRYAWGPIREGLEKREQSIAQDKHDAVMAKQEADKLRADLARQI